MSPELSNHNRETINSFKMDYENEKSDIFSIGVIILRMILLLSEDCLYFEKNTKHRLINFPT